MRYLVLAMLIGHDGREYLDYGECIQVCVPNNPILHYTAESHIMCICRDETNTSGDFSLTPEKCHEFCKEPEVRSYLVIRTACVCGG